MIAVLAAYFDDSGTHPTSPVVALGGLLGTEDQWKVFEPRWAALLAEPLPGKPPLKQFHLSPLRAGKKEFEGYTRTETDHINRLFKQIILDIDLVTLATAVNRRAWNELVTGAVAEQVGQPEELCFVKCVDSVLATIRWRKPGQRVVIAFDQGIRDRLEIWGRVYLAQADKYPEIAGIGFGKVSEVLPLQGADLIATETYQFAQAWLKDRANPATNPHFKDFVTRDLSGGIILDREHIEEMVARVRERFPSTR